MKLKRQIPSEPLMHRDTPVHHKLLVAMLVLEGLLHHSIKG